MKTKKVWVLIATLIIILLLSVLTSNAHSTEKKNLGNQNEISFELTQLASISSNHLKKHEHPFFWLGPKEYSQNKGDVTCQKIWLQMKSGSKLYAWDGVSISNSPHQWYHVDDGYCVANT